MMRLGPTTCVSKNILGEGAGACTLPGAGSVKESLVTMRLACAISEQQFFSFGAIR
jgi:hypothetical protein